MVSRGYGDFNQSLTNVALGALRALARGEGEDGRRLAREVAAAVMECEAARLARAVLEGGEFADVRAVDLCEMVLREALGGVGEAGDNS